MQERTARQRHEQDYDIIPLCSILPASTTFQYIMCMQLVATVVPKTLEIATKKAYMTYKKWTRKRSRRNLQNLDVSAMFLGCNGIMASSEFLRVNCSLKHTDLVSGFDKVIYTPCTIISLTHK